MKIVYLTDQTSLHGGVEKVLSQKANYLANISEDEVVIITYNQKDQIPVYSFSDKIKMIDLAINYTIGKSYFHPENLEKIPKHFLSLRKKLQTIKPDVIISCSIGPDFYFIPFIEKQIPKIKEFHSSRYFYKDKTSSIKTKLLQKLDKRTEKRYHQLVVLNESERHFYNNKKIAVIPNPAAVCAVRADIHSKKILAAGRISPVKNFGDLIESFSRINKYFPGWELHFYGQDYIGTKLKLEEKIKDLQLGSQVKFKGVTANLQKEMTNYSIYGMTSEMECFPMVLLEALSVGMPVVSYDSPTGPKHILTDNQDSFLVPYKNLDIFTTQLKTLMSDENLRRKLGRAARENVQRFSIDKVMQQWTDLFLQLTGNAEPLPPQP